MCPLSDKYGPTAGDRVSTQDFTFTVARRVKHKDTGVVFLVAPGGERYALDQCKLKVDPYLNRTFLYAGVTAKLMKQFSDIKLTVLRHNGAFAQCRGSNNAYYSWVPLDELKPN